MAVVGLDVDRHLVAVLVEHVAVPRGVQSLVGERERVEEGDSRVVRVRGGMV